jgi:hypothetical protein
MAQGPRGSVSRGKRIETRVRRGMGTTVRGLSTRIRLLALLRAGLCAVFAGECSWWPDLTVVASEQRMF